MLVSSIFFCQLLWAEALYLRDQYQENAPNFLQKQEQILKLACLADILDYPDYALVEVTHSTPKTRIFFRHCEPSVAQLRAPAKQARSNLKAL